MAPKLTDVDIKLPVKFYTDSAVKKYGSPIIETKKAGHVGVDVFQIDDAPEDEDEDEEEEENESESESSLSDRIS